MMSYSEHDPVYLPYLGDSCFVDGNDIMYSRKHHWQGLFDPSRPTAIRLCVLYDNAPRNGARRPQNLGEILRQEEDLSSTFKGDFTIDRQLGPGELASLGYVLVCKDAAARHPAERPAEMTIDSAGTRGRSFVHGNIVLTSDDFVWALPGPYMEFSNPDNEVEFMVNREGRFLRPVRSCGREDEALDLRRGVFRPHRACNSSAEPETCYRMHNVFPPRRERSSFSEGSEQASSVLGKADAISRPMPLMRPSNIEAQRLYHQASQLRHDATPKHKRRETSRKSEASLRQKSYSFARRENTSEHEHRTKGKRKALLPEEAANKVMRTTTVENFSIPWSSMTPSEVSLMERMSGKTRAGKVDPYMITTFDFATQERMIRKASAKKLQGDHVTSLAQCKGSVHGKGEGKARVARLNYDFATSTQSEGSVYGKGKCKVKARAVNLYNNIASSPKSETSSFHTFEARMRRSARSVDSKDDVSSSPKSENSFQSRRKGSGRAGVSEDDAAGSTNSYENYVLTPSVSTEYRAPSSL